MDFRYPNVAYRVYITTITLTNFTVITECYWNLTMYWLKINYFATTLTFFELDNATYSFSNGDAFYSGSTRYFNSTINFASPRASPPKIIAFPTGIDALMITYTGCGATCISGLEI
jgi:hypothetical protein